MHQNFVIIKFIGFDLKDFKYLIIIEVNLVFNLDSSLFNSQYLYLNDDLVIITTSNPMKHH
jgi:hypothetical protein